MIKKVLLVENDRDTLDILIYILEDKGYHVISSATGAVLSRIHELQPDIIILDEWLDNGESGSEWCRRVKADNSTAGIPVLLISTHPRLEDIAHAAGADGFIKKPFDINGFCSTVERYLNS
ncbi:response regulator [Mucilaginibacter hurinus]|uniref:Response regulator n=1 Tax=Mucilaginibacter hurinus TaxID=2201324 RepID=A0A367GK60_9SPHI|nr:response regulator [Mucilaginibacter hurinus]RCH53849.1 response regulator [Mucilaginibacter hurinus]